MSKFEPTDHVSLTEKGNAYLRDRQLADMSGEYIDPNPDDLDDQEWIDWVHVFKWCGAIWVLTFCAVLLLEYSFFKETVDQVACEWIHSHWK